MLVDLVELRATGMRLTQNEIKEARVYRGHLHLEAGYATITHTPEHRVGGMLVPLREARVTRIRGESFLVAGRQPAELYRSEPVHPQVWWCRVAHLPPKVPSVSGALGPEHDDDR